MRIKKKRLATISRCGCAVDVARFPPWRLLTTGTFRPRKSAPPVGPPTWRPTGERSRRTTPALPQRVRSGATLLLAMLAVQMTLGICTLLFVVPMPLAAAHQAGALLLFAALLNIAHLLR
jgi:Cytochrome oxidase assembly protein